MKILSVAFPRGIEHEYPDICLFLCGNQHDRKITYILRFIFKAKINIILLINYTAGVNQLRLITFKKCGKRHENTVTCLSNGTHQ